MRLPLVTDTKSRDGISDKDSRLTNALVEDGKAVVRPGIRTLTSVTAADGKGLVSFNGKLISVFGQSCYMGGVVSEKTSAARSTIPSDYYGAALVRRANNFIISMNGLESSTPVAKVYKSTNGGTTWTLLTSTPGWAATANSYACAWDGTKFVFCTGSEVWNSSDGATWTKVVSSVSASLESGLTNFDMCSDTENGISYLLANKSGGTVQLWKSANDGATWTKVKNSIGAYSGRAEGASAIFHNKKVYAVGYKYNANDASWSFASRFMYECDPATSGTARLIRLPQVLVDDYVRLVAGDQVKFETGWLGLFEYRGDMYLFAQETGAIEGEYSWLNVWKYIDTSSGWSYVTKYPSYYIGDGISNMGITTIVETSTGLLQLPFSFSPTLDELAGKVIKYAIPTPSSVGTVSGDFFDFAESAT